jgi:type II secretion system protein H
MWKITEHSGPPCRTRNNHGFTLIELMVVLVILALLAGMIAPSAVSALRRSGVESQGEKLVEMLRFAQRYAVTSRHAVEANFDSRQGRCWVASINTTFPWVEEEGRDMPEILATLKLPDNILLNVRPDPASRSSENPWQTISFKSDGRAESALLRLTDDRGTVVEVMVMESDGSVHQRDEQSR